MRITTSGKPHPYRSLYIYDIANIHYDLRLALQAEFGPLSMGEEVLRTLWWFRHHLTKQHYFLLNPHDVDDYYRRDSSLHAFANAQWRLSQRLYAQIGFCPHKFDQEFADLLLTPWEMTLQYGGPPWTRGLLS